MHGRFTRATERPVTAPQAAYGVSRSGVLSRRTWSVLLSDGPKPILKYGSAGNPVRRLQRALNAATGARLAITGVFAAETRRAVKDLQRAAGRPTTGVVNQFTWEVLVWGGEAGG